MFTTQSPYFPIYLSFSIWTHPFVYCSVTSESPASLGSNFFLLMEEAEKLVRAETDMKASSSRGRLSTGTARRGGLEDVGKRETHPGGKKGKGAEKKYHTKFKTTFRQPRTCVSIQMLSVNCYLWFTTRPSRSRSQPSSIDRHLEVLFHVHTFQ